MKGVPLLWDGKQWNCKIKNQGRHTPCTARHYQLGVIIVVKLMVQNAIHTISCVLYVQYAYITTWLCLMMHVTNDIKYYMYDMNTF